MEAPGDPLSERGRAIFDRLRAAQSDVETPPAPTDDTPAEGRDQDLPGAVAVEIDGPPGADRGPADDLDVPTAGDPDIPTAGDPAESDWASPGPDGGLETGTGPAAVDPPVVADPATPVEPAPDPDPLATTAGAASVEMAADPDPLAATAAPSPPQAVPDPDPLVAAAAPTPRADAGNGAALLVVHPLPRILAIANQKGGVGKTTTAVNLGAGLAELGYRVLVVDLDPQGNATTGLGINGRNLEISIYDVIMNDAAIDDCIEATSLRNLFVAPATIDLAGAEIELVPAFSRELKLRRAVQTVEDEFDFTLIDCPPSLGLLTINGLTAAHEVVVPIQCEYYALEGLGQLMRNIALVKTNLNPRLELTTIVLTMYDARTKLADQVAREVRGHFGPKVCRNVVPRTVRLSEAPSFGQPVTVFDPTSRGAIAYRELAKEVAGGAPQRAR